MRDVLLDAVFLIVPDSALFSLNYNRGTNKLEYSLNQNLVQCFRQLIQIQPETQKYQVLLEFRDGITVAPPNRADSPESPESQRPTNELQPGY
jgi:hypothetical protein